MFSRLALTFGALFAVTVSGLANPSTTDLAAPSAAAASATPGAGSHGYTYAGCYNETTGYAAAGNPRALANGIFESDNALTTSYCLQLCAANGTQYCGMEYGRECWGATYLNSFSTLLNSSLCNDACDGNASEVCGGSLAITLFNLTASSKSGAAATGPVTGVLGAAVLLGSMTLAVVFGL